MPELPEVETIRRGLDPWLVGRTIGDVVVRRRDLRRPVPRELGAVTRGRRVARLGRRGKYLLIAFEDPGGLILHLGMSGRVARYGAGEAPAAGPHDHVDFLMTTGEVLRFTDARRFGFVDLFGPEGADAHPALSALGIEPLSPALTPRALEALLAGRAVAIKAALLDQRLIAGLGNIYACEALFRAGLSPRRGAGTVKGVRAARLTAAIRRVLSEAIAAGGSSLRDFRHADGALGYFQAQFAVYGRAGERCAACPDDAGGGCRVQCIRQHGRSTFYCPRRQR